MKDNKPPFRKLVLRQFEISRDLLNRLHHQRVGAEFDPETKRLVRSQFDGDIPQLYPSPEDRSIPLAGRSEAMARSLRNAVLEDREVFLAPKRVMIVRDDGSEREIIRYEEWAREPERAPYLGIAPDGIVELVDEQVSADKADNSGTRERD